MEHALQVADHFQWSDPGHYNNISSFHESETKQENATKNSDNEGKEKT